MFPHTFHCGSRALLTGVAASFFLLLALAVPAVGHTEVSAQPAQAGASDAVLTFTAEAESSTAGTTSLQVQLPAGIPPAAVGYVSGPAGWVFTTSADGYTVAGPALPAGEDASYQVKVATLPDQTALVFKTLQTYSDGRVDRWIDVATPGGGEPAHPAPVLSLAPAPPSSAVPSSAAPASPAPPPTSTPVPTAGTATTATADGDEGGVPAVVWILVGVGVLTGGGAAWALGRRRAGSH